MPKLFIDSSLLRWFWPGFGVPGSPGFRVGLRVTKSKSKKWDQHSLNDARLETIRDFEKVVVLEAPWTRSRTP